MCLTGNGNVPHRERISSPGIHIVRETAGGDFPLAHVCGFRVAVKYEPEVGKLEEKTTVTIRIRLMTELTISKCRMTPKLNEKIGPARYLTETFTRALFDRKEAFGTALLPMQHVDVFSLPSSQVSPLKDKLKTTREAQRALRHLPVSTKKRCEVSTFMNISCHRQVKLATRRKSIVWIQSFFFDSLPFL